MKPALALLLSAVSCWGQARLKANIERITRSVNAEWGVYVKCLETGEEIALNADRQMDTMSVIKIPLMVEVFRQIGEGKLSLADRVLLKDSDKLPGTGVLKSLDAGAALTVRDLITLMNVVSDNTATDLLFEKVGGVEPVNRLMASYGLSTIRAPAPSRAWFAAVQAAPNRDEFHRQGKTPFGLGSARDIGRLLERIAAGQAVSKASSEHMLQILRGQVYRTRLPKYVTGFDFPHKTGDFLPYIANDVGIQESPARHVVVCVLTAKHFGVGANLEDAIARIGEQIADYFGR